MSALSTMKGLVREALRTKLWAVSGIPAAGYRKIENVELDLKALAGSTWVREFTQFGDLTPGFIGAGAAMPQRFKASGSYMVDLFFPKGTSTTAADALEGAVIDSFAPGTSLTASTVRVLILSCSSSRQQDDQDGWYFRPLMIAWECYVIQ